MIVPTFKVFFNLDDEDQNFPYGNFVLVADDVYSQYSINLSDVIGYYTITFPDGGQYIGNFITPDFTPAQSFHTSSIAIPHDSFGQFMAGKYFFKLTVRVTGPVLPGTYESEIFEIDVSQIFCDIPKALNIKIESDCAQRKIKAKLDLSLKYFTLDNSILTLVPPANTGQLSYIVSSTALTYSFTYTGLYQVTANVLLKYEKQDYGIYVRVKDNHSKSVRCDYDLCSLFKCINNYYEDLYKKAKKYGGISHYLQPNTLQWEQYHLLPELIIRHDKAMQCGLFGVADRLYEYIKEIVNCDCDCNDCDDDTPKLVNPYNNNNNNTLIEVNGISPVIVTKNVTGNSVTYTVSLSTGLQLLVSTLQNQIDDFENNLNLLNTQVTDINNQLSTIQNAINDNLNVNVFKQIVAERHNYVISSANTFTSLLSYTIPAGEENGTEWYGLADFLVQSVPSDKNFLLRINYIDVFVLSPSLFKEFINMFHAEFRLHKRSNTLLSFWMKVDLGFSFAGFGSNILNSVFKINEIIVPDMSANSTIIQLVGADSIANNMRIVSGTIKKFIKAF